MTNLYIARHGQTYWNVEHRIQGKQDSPLTEHGVVQASQLARRLSRIDFDIICSSSSSRAVDTARIIARNRPVIEYDDFREISLGEWEGMKRDEIDRLYPHLQHLYWNNPAEFRPVGDGETFLEVRERVLPLLRSVLDSNPGKNILLITHTVIVKTIMGYFENRPIDRFWDPPRIHPASLSHIVLDGDSVRIKEYGDTSHYRFNT